jgi:ThiF family protein
MGELRAVAADQGVDLDRFLRDGTADLHDRADHLLLAGFPVPVRIGEPDRQMHWQAIQLPRLERKVINGFRPNALGYWLTSKDGTLADARPLEWLMAENWHPDQLATRGRLDARLASSQVVLIGAGALGSMIGELLVRAGVWDIMILDHDVVLAGNLVRHTLTLDDLGKNKAEALARRLASISPSVRAVAIEDRFPGGSLDPRILGAGLVIDTTGEHKVLEAMAEAEWAGDPTFASFAISMHARRLFAFLAQSNRFDAGVFDAAYGPFGQEERDRDEERPWEGVGCWHPVFPARADEMWLMASTAIGLLDGAWPIAAGSSALHVFERSTGASGQFNGVTKIAP